MAFTIFAAHTMSDANELVDNFYYCFKSDRLPRENANLETTTGSLDIGSATYRWNNIYCTTLNVSGNLNTNSLWNLEGRIEITSTSSSITISGLNGDIQKKYYIDILFKDISASTTLNLFLSGDSSASYGYQKISVQNTTRTSTRDVSETYITACNSTRIATTTATRNFSRILIYAETGFERTAMINELNSYENRTTGAPYLNCFNFSNYVWSNTSSTITSLVFESSVANQIGTGTVILLWSKK